MKRLTMCLPFVTFALWAPAQQPSFSVPEPGSSADGKRPAAEEAVIEGARAAIARQLADPDFLAIDEAPDGTVWAAGGSYKAAFGADGWSFTGRPGEGNDGASPIGFRLRSVHAAGVAIELGASSRTRRDRRIEYAFGGVVEAIDVRGDGVEQTFTFAQLPRRGELVVTIGVATALAGANTDAGIEFRGPFDAVRYSPAVAIDAAGDRVAAPTTLAGDALTIRVPADFVERAALPLVIDPVVHAIQVYSSTTDVGDPDLAWDDTGNVWAVSFARVFAAGDWDCYVQRVSLGNPMTLVGGLTTIDASSVSWPRPRIANLAVYDTFLVVAQTRTGSTGTWDVRGRLMANSGPTISNQFDIANTGVDELRPDVGGDSGPPPCAFTVVWEHATSPGNHDIQARQVEPTGALRPGPVTVAGSAAHQTWPTISKSTGGGNLTTRVSAVVYQQLGAGEDVRGSFLTRDGALILNGVGTSFPIANSGFHETQPHVSSATLPSIDGTRLWLVAYERNENAGDIWAACFDQTGTVRASASVQALEQSSQRTPWPQKRPSVDSDGLRFVVCYDEVYSGNTTANDLDTRATTLALAGSALSAGEKGTWLGASGGKREFNVQIASRYSGTGAYSRHFNTAHDRDGIPSGNLGIEAYSFDLAPAGAFLTRPTVCGLLGIGVTGTPELGNPMTFALSGYAGVPGFVFGAPVSVPIAACSGCTLGVDGVLVVGGSLPLVVPASPSLFGATFAAQGFSIEPVGPCFGQIHLSNTIDFTIG